MECTVQRTRWGTVPRVNPYNAFVTDAYETNFIMEFSVLALACILANFGNFMYMYESRNRLSVKSINACASLILETVLGFSVLKGLN